MFKSAYTDRFTPVSCPGGETSKCKCEFCDNSWDSETEVYMHKSEHSGAIKAPLDEYKYFCRACLQRYKLKKSLRNHIKMCHLFIPPYSKQVVRTMYVCDKCDNIFFNKKMLVLHLSTVCSDSKGMDKVFECPKCLRTYKRKFLYSHFYKHSLPSICSCPFCLDKYKNWNDLNEHVQSNHPKVFKCCYCAITFSNNELLKEHEKTHKIEILNDDACGYKELFIPKRQLFWRHRMLKVFNGYFPQNCFRICILCQTLCNNNSEMQKHFLAHKNVLLNKKPEEFECVCGQTFALRIFLRKHIFDYRDSLYSHTEIIKVTNSTNIEENNIQDSEPNEDSIVFDNNENSSVETLNKTQHENTTDNMPGVITTQPSQLNEDRALVKFDNNEINHTNQNSVTTAKTIIPELATSNCSNNTKESIKVSVRKDKYFCSCGKVFPAHFLLKYHIVNLKKSNVIHKETFLKDDRIEMEVEIEVS